MAKILLADDNSNVHKTVALALADLGIEVSSVSNGDAAIKKLTEFTPDLVLADIFMPVRSGYEVCEYVKKSSRFAQIPVVLLVGAFDPLDEREAQRVGADGILKKPFVPPDPLITMVKSLLHRILGDRLSEMAASKEPVGVFATAGPATSAETGASSPQLSAESSGQEFPSPMGRVDFGDSELPVAFGKLLETSAMQSSGSESGVLDPVGDEHILTSSRDATLGEPIFWKNDSSEVEPREESSPEGSTGLEIDKWTQAEDPTLPRGEATSLLPIEPLEFVSEEQDETGPSTVNPEPIQLDPAAQTQLTVDSSTAQDLAANPIEWLAAALPESAVPPGWEEQIPDASDTLDTVEQDEVKPSDESNAELHGHPQLAEEAHEQVPPNPGQSPDDTVPSLPSNDWAELTAVIRNRANEAIAQPVESASERAAQVSAARIDNSSPAAVNPPKTAASDSELVEAIVTRIQDSKSAVSGSVQTSADAPDPALVEAVVQRVINKMSPQVVEVITREFLRPIVQALVHRAIEKQ